MPVIRVIDAMAGALGGITISELLTMVVFKWQCNVPMARPMFAAACNDFSNMFAVHSKVRRSAGGAATLTWSLYSCVCASERSVHQPSS